MLTEKEKNYYIKRKPKLMKLFDTSQKLVRNFWIERFGDAKFEELFTNIRQEFETLIPELPYIGGRKNRNYDNLINSTIMLAVIRGLENEGLEFQEIGKLCYDLYETYYEILPTSREEIFQQEYISQLKKDAKESQLRKYPEDWVFEFVKGDRKTFDYGVNYSECAIYKFFKKLNVEHLVPILCVSDYARARASKYGLKRTQSIGNGAPICDFRYIKGGKAPRGWPLDDLPDF